MRQRTLFKLPPKPKPYFGGELALKKRKGTRPLATRKPIHFTLKARKSIWNKRAIVVEELDRLAKRFLIRLYHVGMEHNHLHFVVKIPSREHYVKFICALTGLLARKLGKGIWKLLPFSRIANWGRDYRNLIAYLAKNRAEAAGEQPYEPRVDHYRRERPK